MKIFSGIASVIAILGFAGCHQGTNPSVPLAPMNPLVGATRVAPPPTGSFVVPDAYSSGTAASPTDQSSIVTPSLNTVASQQSETTTAYNPSNIQLTGGADSSVIRNSAGFSNVSRVEPVGYAASVSKDGSQLSPASALQLSGTVDPASSMPAMRGMQVVDLTNPESAKPALSPIGSDEPQPKNASDLNWRQPF